ncbi:unnamed protein product [Toxocara canis]|uniref:Reelin domain-containing protein n=1 Tax=Toxocara canis TaxID=6265 RepID=A0A183TV19_TOXCA|nr:unnamed protein product [Toxocara canis]
MKIAMVQEDVACYRYECSLRAVDMLLVSICIFIAVLVSQLSDAWPDGSPCVHSAFESMNPLEAVEHQGGLQLNNPPYTIEIVQKCYWRNQPIELTLKGNTTSDKFRGFVIQPIVYRGPHQGKRMGQFLRLDDNGSWQQQCFRFKDSVTHSHDEKKKHIKLWWKNDLNEVDTVQFVATVVKAQKEFWVKSVLSVPIPPCQLSRDGITDYVPPPVTPPPPVRPFPRSNEFH